MERLTPRQFAEVALAVAAGVLDIAHRAVPETERNTYEYRKLRSVNRELVSFIQSFSVDGRTRGAPDEAQVEYLKIAGELIGEFTKIVADRNLLPPGFEA